MEHTFTVVLLHEQDGRYVARVPALGCASLGSTSSEAFRRVKEALACHLETLEAHGERIEAIERPKAEAREKAGKAQADPVESCHRVETGKTRDVVAQAEGRCAGGHARQGSLVETCHHAAKTRDVVARAVGGMSGRTSEQALW